MKIHSKYRWGVQQMIHLKELIMTEKIKRNEMEKTLKNYLQTEIFEFFEHMNLVKND